MNGILFGDWPDDHTRFQLRNPDGRLCLPEDVPIHLIELPKFRKRLEELEKPLDLWLYFLQTGDKSDADALPGSLDIPEIRWAMEVLAMLAQNDLERELCEGRLKAKCDLQTLEALRDQWQQRYPEAEHRLDVVSRERDEARRYAEKRGFAERVRLSHRLLKRPVDEVEDPAVRSLDGLRNLADRLKRDLTGSP